MRKSRTSPSVSVGGPECYESRDLPQGVTTSKVPLPPMSTYVLGLLLRAPNRAEISDAEAEEIQEGHLAHINRMRERGDLIVAGPLLDDGNLRGILIFRTSSVDQVQHWTEGDPAIQQHRLVLELHQLFAPAGLQVIPPPPGSPA